MQEDIFLFTERGPGQPERDPKYLYQNLSLRYSQMDRLCQSVQEGNEYAACQIMEERFRAKSAGRLQDELTERKYDLILLSALMGQKLREAGIEDLHLEQVYADVLKKIEKTASIEECFRLAVQTASDYCRLSRLKSFRHYSPLVREIILTVDMDLCQPLTLHYFAERLNVNSSYLSSLFKKEAGLSLTEYVTARRMNRAASLLITSQLPIKTIAEQIGIADVHYFSRIFKKKTGMTPRRYRENRKPSPGPAIPQDDFRED